ncbi:class I lanthipeptide [Taibaiella koreensis]|uniref:class I lanthipeptide n=1 Tax=Taibaiella koreensis TaxID=1268548 RepID=UPI0013C2F0ED|nr:class I lanthipeptide [Taibaiella koreensis]
MMKKKSASTRLSLKKKTIVSLGEQKMYLLRGGSSEVDPFTCLSQVMCSDSKHLFTCKC